MVRLMQLFRIQVLPDGPKTHEALKWVNYVVVPLWFMFAGLHKAWATATTPFEEFVGTILAVGFALLWAIFVSVLPKRRGFAPPPAALLLRPSQQS